MLLLISLEASPNVTHLAPARASAATESDVWNDIIKAQLSKARGAGASAEAYDSALTEKGLHKTNFYINDIAVSFPFPLT